MPGTKITTYKQLRVWQASMDFAVMIYRIMATFPQAERFGLTMQLRKAAGLFRQTSPRAGGVGAARSFDSDPHLRVDR